MDIFQTLISQAMRPEEVIIYLLVESGDTYRELAEKLGTSHATIGRIYNDAKEKMAVYADHGLLQTQL